MSRIAATLTQRQKEGRKALIPYVMAGYPNAHITPELMHGMVAAGADIIELGVPFSDPIDRKSTRLNSSHIPLSRMPSSA